MSEAKFKKGDFVYSIDNITREMEVFLNTSDPSGEGILFQCFWFENNQRKVDLFPEASLRLWGEEHGYTPIYRS